MGVRSIKFLRAMCIQRLKSGPPVRKRGYIPVAVGVDDETKRFMVHRSALCDAKFLELLGRSEQEYGFCNEGILRIPDEANDFEKWMSKVAKHKPFLEFRP